MDDGCIHNVDTKLSIDLHPSKLRDVLGSVREQLDGLLLSFRDDLDGVVLAYSNVKILNTTADISGFFQYFHIDVTATLHVLRICKEQHLVGTVNKVGQDFLGLLILGAFNAVIKQKDMRTHFQYDTACETWVSTTDPSHVIALGSEVVFKVKKLEKQEHVFLVIGSIKDNTCGSAAVLLPNRPASVTIDVGFAPPSGGFHDILAQIGAAAPSTETKAAKKSKKAKKAAVEVVDAADSDVPAAAAAPGQLDQAALTETKKKRRKSEPAPAAEEINEQPAKKKKKKKTPV